MTWISEVKSRKNEQVIQRLRTLLQSGRYPKESRLPPERQLCFELNVSRAALRKALSILEAENLIWRHVGRGTFVGPRIVNRHAVQIAVSESTNPAEVLEMRMIFEPKIAAIAALRATSGDVERMTNALNKSQSAIAAAAFEIWDGALHQAIAQSTGNSLLISFFEAINSLREDKLWGRLKEASFNRDRHQLYCRQHRRLVEAIIDRDAAAAEQLMRLHLESVQKNLMGNL